MNLAPGRFRSGREQKVARSADKKPHKYLKSLKKLSM